MMRFSSYKAAVLLDLQSKLSEEQFSLLTDRACTLDSICMVEYDKGGASRPEPEEVADSIIEEFSYDLWRAK